MIAKSSFEFLDELKENNNREWFYKNKSRYENAKQNIEEFLQRLLDNMNKIDDIEASKLFRIYRDVRFSKDKTPYKTGFGMSLSRRKPHLRGGYYLHLEPESNFLGCGFWGPNSGDLKVIRGHIAADQSRLRSIISDDKFVQTFKALKGDKVKTSPKGYSKDHPAIDLIRNKQFLVSKKYTDQEVMSENFVEKVIQAFATVRPFFDYMSEILSVDLNGVPRY